MVDFIKTSSALERSVMPHSLPLRLFNTLSKKKEIFTPINPKSIGMYVCGPTVYDLAHLGNARPVVVFDVLFRLLQQLYPCVVYVRNITDVDDKINAAAFAKGISIHDLTIKTTRAFHQDMLALNALPPTHEPRATDEIPAMITMIQVLITKGFAYESMGHVLFEVSTFHDYCRLTNRCQDEMLAGARVEVEGYKKNPGDFVLWKPSKDHEPSWPSPWGDGRPGWHIECSAMSYQFLGIPFDIHGGGIDLVFPHHENEIAQSCCAFGVGVMANYWLHNGHLTVEEQKMSKSLGNFMTVNDLLTRHKGEVIRLALLNTHYRKPLDFQEHTLVQTKTIMDRWYGALRDQEEGESPQQVEDDEVLQNLIPRDFLAFLVDDLNTSGAISWLHQLVAQIYQHSSKSLERLKLQRQLKNCGMLLGLFKDTSTQWFQNIQPHPNLDQPKLENNSPNQLSTEEIDTLITARNTARQNKNFCAADEIRQTLLIHGITLEDTPQGTTWRL